MLHRSCAALFAIVVTIPLWADSWSAPRPGKFTSENQRYVLRTAPQEAGFAIAILWSARDGKEEKKWQAKLVNIPTQAYISEDGSRVVTINTHYRCGYEHSIVVYDEKGKLLADHSDEDFLTQHEIETKVEVSVTSRWWASGVQFRFEPKQNEFVAELRWGRTVRIFLVTGQIVPGEAVPFTRSKLRG